ncbi:MAG: hypothetical protein JW934_09575 [Anaerolineae bacterium]|nr:hypothetical protein [Anaerolineae bacterium]
MTDNGPQHVSVRTFRNEIKEILDGTRFLQRHYIITNRDRAVARVIPPAKNWHTMDDVTVTDVRTKTREVLEAVEQHNKTFLIVRYGRPEALICPLQPKECTS